MALFGGTKAVSLPSLKQPCASVRSVWFQGPWVLVWQEKQMCEVQWKRNIKQKTILAKHSNLKDKQTSKSVLEIQSLDPGLLGKFWFCQG